MVLAEDRGGPAPARQVVDDPGVTTRSSSRQGSWHAPAIRV